MANPRIPYRFSNEGPPLTPPAGGNILVHLVVNVEHWSFDAPMPRTIITPPHGKETVPDVPNFSWVDYGMRCGLPRIIDAITSRGLTASTSFNASVMMVRGMGASNDQCSTFTTRCTRILPPVGGVRDGPSLEKRYGMRGLAIA